LGVGTGDEQADNHCKQAGQRCFHVVVNEH